MSEPESLQELDTQEGYALWAASYDEEKNLLIILEEFFHHRFSSRPHRLWMADAVQAGGSEVSPAQYTSYARGLSGGYHRERLDDPESDGYSLA